MDLQDTFLQKLCFIDNPPCVKWGFIFIVIDNSSAFFAVVSGALDASSATCVSGAAGATGATGVSGVTGDSGATGIAW